MRPLEAGEPTVIGPYRLLGRLGSGGMGRVYLGRSAGGRTVAVKSVHPHFALDDTFRKRFRREVEAARRVGGDWTAPVLDADPDAPVPWVATGYVAGPTLAAAVTPPDGAPAPLPERTVRVLGASLAEALAHVHAQDLVHRDVKPSNVLLTMDGPRLIDFGIARATDGTASLTNTGASVGSPGYMAPEQILGRDVTGASDVFSLGAVLALAARGRPPFRGEASAVLLYKVVHEEPELDGLDGDLLDVVARCLAKDPGMRPAPQELARSLAPDGASDAVAAGWLPASLVAELGRSAVRLLDLEAGSPEGPTTAGSPAVEASSVGSSVAEPLPAEPPSAGSAPAGPVSEGFGEPVGFGGPMGSVGPGASAGPGWPGGYTGSAGSAGSAGPGESVGSVPAGFGAAGFGPAAPGANGSNHDSAAPTGSGHPTPPPPSGRRRAGRLSLTVGGGPDGRRGPRMSCVVALAVAGALAVVSVGTVVTVRGLLGTESAAGQQGEEPSAAGSAEPSRSPTSAGDVPRGYLGTWRFDLPPGTVRADGTIDKLVVHQGGLHQDFATLTQTTAAGEPCQVLLKLRTLGDEDPVSGQTPLLGAGRAKPGNPSRCPEAPRTVGLTLQKGGQDLQVAIGPYSQVMLFREK